ncbi:hypothetical protein CPB97_008348 [Podila verticillata]|nr:hypothetical protein CPB97_008348 [Podila verticillata]
MEAKLSPQRIRNQEESPLLQLPFELLRLVVANIGDPFDLFILSHVSSFLLKQAIVPKDWFRLYRLQLQTWSKGIQLDDLPDLIVQDISGIVLHLCAWKRHALREACFHKRNTCVLPPPVPSDNSTNATTPVVAETEATEAEASEAEATEAEATTETATSLMQDTVLDIAVEHTVVALPQHLPLPQHHGEVSLEFQSSSHSLTSSTMTTINLAAADITAPTDVTDNLAMPMTKVCVPLGEARSYLSDPETAASNFKRIGSPVYHTDSVAKSTIAASIVARQLPLPEGVPVNQSYEHRLLLYSFPDLTSPIAVCDSELWLERAKSASPWNHSPQVTQVIDIKHYPRSRDAQSKMRVLVLLAFGDNAGPLAQEGGDLHILDIWKLVMAIELWIPAASSDSIYNIQELGQVGFVLPTTTNRPFRGRMANLYTAPDPVTQEPLDCMALFGIQHSAESRAIIIKAVLFQDEALYPFSKKTLGRNVSCMTTFPSDSGYERLLVIFNRLGRGMIWDWVNEKQVAQLHLPQDEVRRAGRQEEHDSEPSATVATQAQGGQATPVIGSTPPAGVGAAGQDPELYFWGVQVNWAVELPHTLPVDPTQRRSFRIVILADGALSEWKACWWHVDSDMLGILDVDLRAPVPSPTNATSTNEPPQIWYATSTRFENESLGVYRNGQVAEPLLFIAFVIWNRYMIGLTSRLGVTMLAMEEGQSRDGVDRQWVSCLEDSENNPLVDVATVGDCLVITRRHSHLVWFFYS